MATTRPRPILAIRIIGPAETVNNQKAYLAAYLAEAFRHEKAVCRTSTHPASHTGEIRAYLTLTRKENN